MNGLVLFLGRAQSVDFKTFKQKIGNYWNLLGAVFFLNHFFLICAALLLKDFFVVFCTFEAILVLSWRYIHYYPRITLKTYLPVKRIGNKFLKWPGDNNGYTRTHQLHIYSDFVCVNFKSRTEIHFDRKYDQNTVLKPEPRIFPKLFLMICPHFRSKI